MNNSFQEAIGAPVKARFVLNDQQQPQYFQSANGRKNYSIQLSIEGASSETAAVTYKLDNSYLDPVRTTTDASQGFAQQIKSYGDYPIIVEAQVGSRVVAQRIMLSELLRSNHEDSVENGVPDETFQQALRDIENN